MLAAAAVWAVVDLVLVLLVGSPAADGRFAAGLVVTLALTTTTVWLVARRRRWHLTLLLVLTAPVFFILRAIVGALLG